MSNSTGELLYALGLVRNAQGRYEEGLSYFQRALAQFKKTDEDGPSMAKAHYKIARYYLKKKQVVLAGYAFLAFDCSTQLRKH